VRSPGHRIEASISRARAWIVFAPLLGLDGVVEARLAQEVGEARQEMEVGADRGVTSVKRMRTGLPSMAP